MGEAGSNLLTSLASSKDQRIRLGKFGACTGMWGMWQESGERRIAVQSNPAQGVPWESR
jgi:hypothetical protein